MITEREVEDGDGQAGTLVSKESECESERVKEWVNEWMDESKDMPLHCKKVHRN